MTEKEQGLKKEKTKEDLQIENEQLRNMANNMARYLISLTPMLEDGAKKLVSTGTALFTLSDNIKTIARPIQPSNAT